MEENEVVVDGEELIITNLGLIPTSDLAIALVNGEVEIAPKEDINGKELCGMKIIISDTLPDLDSTPKENL